MRERLVKYGIPTFLLAAFWVITLAIFLHPEPESVDGVAHPDYGQARDQSYQMAQGGAGAERHGSILVHGWLMVAILASAIVYLLAWGASRGMQLSGTISGRGRERVKFVGLFLLGFFLFQVVLAAIFLSYSVSLLDPPNTAFWGPFPTATSLVFVAWITPVFFVALYVIFFNRWILSPRGVERFHALMKMNRQSRQQKDI
jgi:hypothetical protein